tara:strand:+ start:69 stop:1391 length:1323 start_codon:yes stop_codon:yes gene_type:complete
MVKITPKQGNKTFCTAPWTHTYLSPTSERRLCCASTEPAQSFTQYIDTADGSNEFDAISLDHWWNSDHLKSVRKRMLAGETLPECNVCNNKLLHTTVYRDHFNSLYRDLIDQIYNQTQEDGSTDMKVISFDYRFTNLCNFMCRMCGSNLSSSWETEERKYIENFDEHRPWATKENKAKLDEFVTNIAEPEFEEAVNDGRIREVYWVGGEPLMYSQHWKYMKMIVDKNLANQVYARYNTNLSRIVFKKLNLFDDILVKYKSWLVCASIDGTGPTGEYIRTGLNYEKFIENFEHGLKFADIKKNKRILLDYTITTAGIFEIENMFKLSQKYDVQIITKQTFAFSSEVFMSVKVIPRHIRTRILTNILTRLEPIATQRQKGMIDQIKRLIDQEDFDDQYDDVETGRVKGKEFINDMESRRQNPITMREIMYKDQELGEWYDSI